MCVPTPIGEGPVETKGQEVEIIRRYLRRCIEECKGLGERSGGVFAREMKKEIAEYRLALRRLAKGHYKEVRKLLKEELEESLSAAKSLCTESSNARASQLETIVAALGQLHH